MPNVVILQDFAFSITLQSLQNMPEAKGRGFAFLIGIYITGTVLNEPFMMMIKCSTYPCTVVMVYLSIPINRT